MAFHPEMNMKLKTASNTMMLTFVSKNQMKNAATDDSMKEAAEKAVDIQFVGIFEF